MVEKKTKSLKVPNNSRLIGSEIDMSLLQLYQLENLSVWTYNTCFKKLKSLNKIIYHYNQFKTFRNLTYCSVAINNELLKIVVKYSRPTKNVIAIANFYCKYGLNLNVHFPNFAELYKHKKVPLIKIFELVILESTFLKEDLKDVFRNINSGNRTSLEEIALKYNYSKERIRQKRNALIYQMFQKGNIVEDLITELNKRFEIGVKIKEGDFIVIDNKLVESINKYNNTNLSKLFIVKILSVLYPDYTLASSFWDKYKSDTLVFSKRIKVNELNSNFYLIRNELYNPYIFEVISKLDMLNKSKKIESIQLAKQQILFELTGHKDNSVEYTDVSKTDLLFNLFVKISELEFNIKLKGDKLVIERNLPLQPFEIIRDLIKKNQTPIHISNLFLQINNAYPELNMSENSIRALIFKHRNEFISFGRTSTYGLKSWEKVSRKNIKGGSIRELVKELLLRSPAPLHQSKIIKYVCKFRETNESNIIQNLKLDKNIFFSKDNYITCKEAIKKKKHNIHELRFNNTVRKNASKNEIWKPILGTKKVYYVSNKGRLKRFRYNPEGEIVNYSYSKRQGYGEIVIYIKKKPKKFLIHRLVAEYFIPKESEDQIYVTHIDDNPNNNYYKNLKWITQNEYNQRNSERFKKNNLAYSKLNKNDVIELKKLIRKGVRNKIIMNQFGISETQFHRIKNGTHWGYIE